VPPTVETLSIPNFGVILEESNVYRKEALLAAILLGAYTTRVSHCCALERWNTKLERFQVWRMVRLSLECLTNGAPRLCPF